MTFEEFDGRARAMWAEIPPEAREGVARLAVEGDALAHPDFDWVYTMGECVTDEWPSGFGGEGQVRSELVLYHGSFAALAGDDASFDWEGELWETILHELLHHREAAAGEFGLDEIDWAEEQNFRRLAGDAFDPDFFRAVPADEERVFRLDSEMFVAVEAPERSSEARFEWRGRGYQLRIPAGPYRVFVAVPNLAGGRLSVVVLRHRPWWRFGGRIEVLHLVGSALPLPAAA